MSVGVIGGSDGPTRIWVTGAQDWTLLAIVVGVLAVAGVAFWLWRRWKGKK